MNIKRVSAQENIGKLYGMDVIVDETLPEGSAFIMERESINDAIYNHYGQIEKHIKTKIKPRPWWLPIFLHRWLIKNLLTLEKGSDYSQVGNAVYGAKTFSQPDTLIVKDISVLSA